MVLKKTDLEYWIKKLELGVSYTTEYGCEVSCKNDEFCGHLSLKINF